MALRGGNAMNSGSARSSAKFQKPKKKNPYKINFGIAPKAKPTMVRLDSNTVMNPGYSRPAGSKGRRDRRK